MEKESTRHSLLKPLLIAIGFDVGTLGCFIAFYTFDTGKEIWLAIGLLLAVLSFPFYKKVLAAALSKKTK